jgi:hypothetical protein
MPSTQPVPELPDDPSAHDPIPGVVSVVSFDVIDDEQRRSVGREGR